MNATVLVVAGALAVTVALGFAALRMVPAGHCGVVIRAGRVARLRSSGLVLVVPGVERVAIMIMHPRSIDPPIITARTRDGVEVRLVVSVLGCVVDPTLAVQAAPDVRAATEDAVERALHDLVANVDLANRLRDRESTLARLPATALPLLSSFGVELIDVDLLDAEVRSAPSCSSCSHDYG
jgi:regulator of protease activity HflC (stomatin/prohibitin superfamily)